jgi:hypothetical protein
MTGAEIINAVMEQRDERDSAERKTRDHVAAPKYVTLLGQMGQWGLKYSGIMKKENSNCHEEKSTQLTKPNKRHELFVKIKVNCTVTRSLS